MSAQTQGAGPGSDRRQDDAERPAGGAGPGEEVRDLVVVAASAGGVEALTALLAGLPTDLAAAVLVVLHIPRTGSSSLLPHVLGRTSALPVRAAADGERLQPGVVLVAVPDRHLMVEDGRVVLSAGPVENGSRPAADPLFRSAARGHGSRVVGVVLTGNLEDGAAGLLSVARHGGATVVQDPEDALFPGMPEHALVAVPGARVTSLARLSAVVAELVGTPALPPPPLPAGLDAQESVELDLSFGRSVGPRPDAQPGAPSAWSCPDCSGVLWEVQDGDLVRFRCRTGHAWGLQGLVDEQGRGAGTALWIALRALEERAALALRVSDAAGRAGREWSEAHFRDRAREAETHAAVLRRLLHGGPGDGSGRPTDPQPPASGTMTPGPGPTG